MNFLMNTSSYLALLAAPSEGTPGGKPTVLNKDVGGENDGAAGDGEEEAGSDAGAEGAAGGGDAPGDGAEGQDEGAEGAPEAAPEAAPPKPDWRDREISRKHRRLQDAERRAREAEQRAQDAEALLQRQQGDNSNEGDVRPAPAARAYTAADVDRAADAKVAKQDYDAACDATFEKGKTDYGDDKWEAALNRLGQLGGFGDGPQSVEIMQSILATDDPAKVLYTLGSDPDTYHKVMDLTPAKRMAELVKLGIPAPKAPLKKPSETPPPPDGIRRRAEANNDTAKLYDPKTSDDDWFAIRLAQKARRFAEKQGRARTG